MDYEITITVKEAGADVVNVAIRCQDIQKAIGLLDSIRNVSANLVIEQ